MFIFIVFTTKYTFYVWTYVFYTLNFLCSKYFLWLLISFHSNRAEMENEGWYSKLTLFISLLNYLPTLIWSKERFLRMCWGGRGGGESFLVNFIVEGENRDLVRQTRTESVGVNFPVFLRNCSQTVININVEILRYSR